MIRRASLVVLSVVIMASTLAAANGYAGTFPGTNGKLLTSCAEGICLASPDGAGKEVLFAVEGANNYSLSPEGLRVAYQVGFDDGSETNASIYVGSIATGESEQVAAGFDPSWSPDGSSLVIWRYEPPNSATGPHNIYRVGVDSPGVTALTDTGNDIAPVWGPDGRIAFSSVRDQHFETCSGGDTANHDIYVMNGDGGGERNVTNTEGEDELVQSWFPTADELLATRDRDGSPCTPLDRVLWRVPTAGGAGSAVIDPQGGFCQYSGAVSPDRTRVAFMGGTCPSSGSTSVSTTIYVMDLPPNGTTASSGWVQGPSGELHEWTTCAEGRCDLGEPADRQVGLSLRRHLVAVGSIYSIAPECMEAQTVKIQKRVSGVWKTIATADTGDDDIYRKSLPDKEGNYRAKLPATADCNKAISIISGHQH